MREQVGRILATAPFRNSKRFPAFLRHTVEHALSSTGGLKERSIGHEVFGRDPAYDTAQDPVVRMTAAEVRKRLTHYYQLPEHAGEPVISYQPGSYIPEFSLPSTAALATPVAEAAVPSAEPEPPPKRLARRWRIVGPAAVAAIVAVFLLGALARDRLAAPPGPLERFWAPLVKPAAPVLLCIGAPHSEFGRTDTRAEPQPSSRSDLTVAEFLRAESVSYTDAVTLALLAGELRSRGKPFHVRRISGTQLEDLRDGPVVLIGGFNNPWTLRLGEGLRFTLQFEANGPYIRDRDHPESREWQPKSGRLRDISQTYGLITRVQDKSTGRAVLAVSGLVLGTRAAAECLSEPACLDPAQFPTTMDWEHGNLQIVVAAAVIGENSGSPRVAVAHVW
ncbi:MAG: hypothetical protein ABI818_19855 [Acidobacteriota bacterium]